MPILVPQVPLRSVTLQTSLGCTACTVEGVVVALLGETNGIYPGGVPCATATLDHALTIDFAATNSSTTFDGTLEGQEDEEERAMLGSCYQVSPILLLLLLLFLLPPRPP